MAKICITYLLNLAYEDLPKLQDRILGRPCPEGNPLDISEAIYPFVRFAVSHWHQFASRVEMEDVVGDLILKLLNPAGRTSADGWAKRISSTAKLGAFSQNGHSIQAPNLV